MNKFKTAPFLHQMNCLNKFGRREFWANNSEMGTGKTWIAINEIADLWSSGDCGAVLVLAPNGVHTNWARSQIPMHMPEWVRLRMASWHSSPNKQQREALESLMQPANDEPLRMLMMNHEAIATSKGFEFAKRFLCVAGQKPMIVVDEADAYKSPDSIRTKNLMKLKPLSSWRRIMTGTPISNAPFDVFAQFSFLDEHILGTTSYYAFKAEYAEMLDKANPLVKNIVDKIKASKGPKGSVRTPQIVARGAGGRPKYRNLDKLAALIAPHSFRVLKKECVDLPDKIYKNVFFEMTKAQAAVYEKARKELRISFEDRTTAITALTAMTKLSQITSGYYMHPESPEPVRIEGGNPKLDALISRVKSAVEAGEKVIVWARYTVEIEDIIKSLREEKINCVQYNGSTKGSDRHAAIEAFERGDASVFVGNQQAGGTGITLIAASVVIYFSNNFSLRDRLQSEDRAHRIGQTRNVTYINIIAPNTVDEAVMRVLTSKQEVADHVMSMAREVLNG